MSDLDEPLNSAIATLAAGLRGLIEVSHLEHLPKPDALLAPARSSTTRTPAKPAVEKSDGSRPHTVRNDTVDTSANDAVPALVGAALSQSLDEIVARTTPRAQRLAVINDELVSGCTRCKLHRGRTHTVFGVGNPDADLVFVGEGPGQDEDRQGVPFVGRAGQLLTKMIGAMGRDRDRDTYICNVVKCRPPNNRDPERDEVSACVGFLNAQLAVVRPKVIVGLGRVAVHALLDTTTPISKLRGTWQSYQGIPFMPTYHPSYLLRAERDREQEKKLKGEAWNDLKLVMERLKA